MSKTSESSGLLGEAPDGYDYIGLGRKLVCEVIGTFFLVFTISLAAGGGAQLAPLAIGSVLMTQVFCFGHISGGMFNPAVSLAVTIRGKLDKVELLAYTVAQLGGAFAAAGAGNAIIKDFNPNSIGGYPAKPKDVGFGTAVSVEAIWTFALCSVVLNCATTKAQADNSFFGLAIGFTVFAGAVSCGGISGGAFNPAVGTALPLIQGHGEDIGVYWLGPLTGALLAGLTFRFVTAAEDDRHGK
jgi:aquaporin Z